MRFDLRVLGLLAVAAGCGSDSDGGPACAEEPACQSCGAFCRQSTCDAMMEPDPEEVEACTVSCFDRHDAAAAISDQCAATFSTWVECVGELECSEYQAYNDEMSAACATRGLVLMNCPDLSLDFGE